MPLPGRNTSNGSYSLTPTPPGKQQPAFTFGSTDVLYQTPGPPSLGDHTYSNPAVSIESLNNLPAILQTDSAVPETNGYDVRETHQNGSDSNRIITGRKNRLEKSTSVTSENDVQLDFTGAHAGYNPQYKRQGPGVSHINGSALSGKNTSPVEAKWIQEKSSSGDGTVEAKETPCVCKNRRCLFVFVVLLVLAVISAAVVLALYFTLINPEAITGAENSNWFQATTRIPLADGERNSQEFDSYYQQLPSVLIARVDAIMRADPTLAPSYEYSQLDSLRNGSIVADFHLIYNKKVETKKVKETLQKELTQLKINDKKSWKLDPDIKVKALFYLPPPKPPKPKSSSTVTSGATKKLSPSATRTASWSLRTAETRTPDKTQEPSKTPLESSTSIKSSTHSMTPLPTTSPPGTPKTIGPTSTTTFHCSPLISTLTSSPSLWPTPTVTVAPTVTLTTTPTPEFPCKSSEFQCVSGQCIYAHQRCDTIIQCDDKSDEANCTGVCERGLYRCPEGKCIMTEWVCDGDWDCINGTDEKGCRQCNESDFQCTDYSCVPMLARCDGVPHCNDSSDEHHCVRINNVTFNVEMLHQGQWLAVCSAGINSSIAEDICTSVGSGYLQQLSSVTHTSSNYLQYNTSQGGTSLPGSLQKSTTCPDNKVVRVKCADLVCGTPASSILRPYVVHGYTAPQGKWPWQVSVRKLTQHICGGVVLTERHILTAAHCVEEMYDSPHIYEVVLGTSKLYMTEKNRVVATVQKMWKHPEFSNFKEGHDVAVLMLKNPIQFSDKIRPVCLPRSSKDKFPVTARCYVTGWGYTDYYQKNVPDDLQEAKMQLWNTTKCNSTDFYNGTLPSSVLCAGYLSGYISICPGDSGGPLMCQDEHGRWRVVGISSFMSSGCDVPFRPSVFTDVLQEIDFIQNVTSCQFRCANKKCLYDESLICNRVDNCGDNSDEITLCNFNINCTFEDVFMCGYTEDTQGTLNWTRHYKDTPTVDTGPGQDHTGAKYYMYLEASTGKQRDYAILWSPLHQSSKNSCLQFYYHMRGADIGKFSVLQLDRSNPTAAKTIWSASGDQGNKWRMGQVDIEQQRFRIGFRAIRGNGVLGDIAIDDIRLLEGNCPEFTCASDEYKCRDRTQCINKNQECDVIIQCSDNSDEDHCNWSVSCDFEESTKCGWINYYPLFPNYFWRWNSGSTPTPNTGPKFDHTLKNANGHYIYLDAKSGSKGQYSFFVSHPYKARSAFWCLEFYYHMLGLPGEELSQEVQLYVLIDGQWKLHWSAKQNTGDSWRMIRLDLKGNGTYRIGFQGIKREKPLNNISDIAIDDIKTYEGTCPAFTCPTGQVKCSQNLECIDKTKICDGFSDCWDSEDEVNCTAYSAIVDDAGTGKPVNLDCNFDQQTMCAYTQPGVTPGEMQWTLYRLTTPTLYTGPYSDNTTPKGMGYYLYLEASYNTRKEAKFRSPVVRMSQPHCLRFHYHMYGKEMGTLGVYILDPSAPNMPLANWFLQGNQKNKWRYAQLTIPASGPSRRQIVFDGTIGRNLHSDIAVDDILVRKGACPQYKCPDGEYTCKNNSKCIPQAQVCDSTNDCYDYDDEKTCICRKNEFQCTMGMCIFDFKRCDQKQDCPDNSDEKNCTCKARESQCHDGKECVLRDWLCDRQPDCADGSDEWNCSTCTSDQFICKDYSCVSATARCNGARECPDGSDEHDCVKISQSDEIVRAYYGGQYLAICAADWNPSLNDELCWMLGQKSSISSGKIKMALVKYLSLKNPLSSNGLLGSIISKNTCDNKEILTISCIKKECGQPKDVLLTTYMTNGKSTPVTRWPWQVSINEDGSFLCGGTLINHEVVLTAAHCFIDKERNPVIVSKYSVILGSKYSAPRDGIEPPQVRRNARYIITHHSYDTSSQANDIALIFLSEPVAYTDHVKPACLPEAGEEFPTSALCFVTGWGNIDQSDASPPDLQEAKMQLWPKDKCNYESYWNGQIGKDQMCAGYVNGPHSICSGDSGGPLACLNQFKHWTIVGISSFFETSAGCATAGQTPNGFQQVSLKKDWIEQNLASQCKFNCSNGRCLYNAALKCNGKDNCGDNSDEGVHCTAPASRAGINTVGYIGGGLDTQSAALKVCQSNTFDCGNGTCIPMDQFCDGFPQCQDGRDEPVNCNCTSSQFSCKNGRQCIAQSSVCNHRFDCWDRSDETDCKCEDNEFKCGDGLCIPKSSLCDAKFDCNDNSDELNCTCKSTQFKCNNSICIASEDKCNSMDECGDNSDEIGCPCLDRQKKCPDGRCIQEEWFCDGYNDCSDGFDEKGCGTCSADQFQCRDYSCLPLESRCDGVSDCLDHSDEDGCFRFFPVTTQRFGMVQKNMQGQWKFVCVLKWTSVYSDYICQDLGFGISSATSKSTHNATEGYVQVNDTAAGTKLTPGTFESSTCPAKDVAWTNCKEKECGSRSDALVFLTTYVIGGQFAQEGEWPWMGAVYYLDRFQCGATLINEQWLITAAHCFHPNKNLLPHKVNVTLGTINSQDPGRYSKTFAVRSIISHPNYRNMPVPLHDIALIRLSTPLARTDYIRPVCLPKDGHDFGEKSHCYVAGWGIVNQYGKSSTDRLREAKMRLWQPQKCTEVFTSNFNNNTMVCAGYNMGYITACSGDSGGPLMCLDANQNWILTGTLSFGMDCSTLKKGQTKPDVYTKIGYYSSWIQEVLAQYQ
ncbi:uncharacterized protein LOC135503121 isoform X2 [Lineus longissimus]|uniref:uncharacterized protein LOC135503121 isoform X2 n=1 Tax=Lineus longissimus TaxID=88925 RepID=UPI00315C51CF